MKLFAATHQDTQQGWVWLLDPSLPALSIVRIKNLTNGKTIYCESLQIDKNFLNTYNDSQSSRFPINNPQETLVINGWYRAKLGDLPTQSDFPLNIKPCNSWRGRFIACIHHPQTVVRVAAWLGFMSLVLGIIGVALGAASLQTSKPIVEIKKNLIQSYPVSALSVNCGDQTTQSGMNQCAYGEYQNADKELNEVYRTYRSRLDASQKQQIKVVQLAWVKYRDLTCDFESSGVKGGSVYPFTLQSCLTKMTRARLEELKLLTHCEEGDLSCPVWK